MTMTRFLVWLLRRMGYTMVALGRSGKPKPGDCPRCHTRHEHFDMPNVSVSAPVMECDDDF